MVRKSKLPVRWDRLAKDNLDNIYSYISRDSAMAARMVKKELIKLAHSLNDFPEKFSVEEYLSDEPENFRSVSKWSYKIIYEVTEEYVLIESKPIGMSWQKIVFLSRMLKEDLFI